MKYFLKKIIESSVNILCGILLDKFLWKNGKE